MSFTRSLGVALGLAGAAVTLYARQRAARTGRDAGAVLSNLPGELHETRAELQKSLRRAVQAGRQAAVEQEAAIDRQLAEAEAQAQAPGSAAEEYEI